MICKFHENQDVFQWNYQNESQIVFHELLIDGDDEPWLYFPPNFFNISFILIELPFYRKNKIKSKHFLQKFSCFTKDHFKVATKWKTRQVKALFPFKRQKQPSILSDFFRYLFMRWKLLKSYYIIKINFKACVHYFYQIFIFHHMIALQKLWIFFLFNLKSSFRSRDIQILEFLFSPLFFPCQPLLWRLIQEKS